MRFPKSLSRVSESKSFDWFFPSPACLIVLDDGLAFHGTLERKGFLYTLLGSRRQCRSLRKKAALDNTEKVGLSTTTKVNRLGAFDAGLKIDLDSIVKKIEFFFH